MNTTKIINLLLEIASSMSRLYDHTKNRHIGMLTASRGDLTSKENKNRNEQLAEEIRKAGYGFVKIAGRYVENHGTPQARQVSEQSYLVIGPDHPDGGLLQGHLKNWGGKYGQDSILYKPYNSQQASLIGTREGAFPGLNKEHKLGVWHPNHASEFHSVMKGRPFSFEHGAFIYLMSKSFFSRSESLF